MTQRMKKGHGPTNSDDAKSKQDSEKVIDRGPLAAYRIGHNCTVIRLFQVQRWDSLVPLQSDAVAEILAETRDELKRMPDLPGGKLSEYSQLRRHFTRITNNPAATVSENLGDPSSWLDETSTGYSAWTKLVSFSDSVFSESHRCHGWFSFGKALAGFQVRLQFLGDCANLGQDPSIRPVVEAAVRLKEEGWERIPRAIDLLAAQRGRMGELTTQQIFANAVDTSERQLASEAGSFRRHQSVLKQAFELDSVLRSSLLESPLNDEYPDLLDEMQARILDALKGKALMKEELARVVGCDPSQLYQYDRIKQLKKLGLVQLKTRVGYYRPDASPAELDPRTYSTSPSMTLGTENRGRSIGP